MRRCSPFLRAAVCSVLVAASGITAGTVDVLTSAHAASAATTHDNEIYAFGSATFHGSTTGRSLQRPVVAMASTANGAGYWEVAADGGLFSFNAPYYGALAGW